MVIKIMKTEDIPQSLRDEILAVCNAAFGAPFNELFSFIPDGSIHALGYDENHNLMCHAVATERIFRTNNLPEMKAAYIDAVATLPEYQKKGYASQVMQVLTLHVGEAFDIAGLSTYIVPWYANLGWKEWKGPLFLFRDNEVISTPDEKGTVMYYSLPRTPSLDATQSLTASWRPGGGW